MPHDARDFCIVLNLRENALPDYRVLLHVPALFQRQRSWLLEQTWGEANFSDVVNESTEMS